MTIRAVLQFRASPGFRERLAAAETDWLSISAVDEDDETAFAAAMPAQISVPVLVLKAGGSDDGVRNFNVEKSSWSIQDRCGQA